MSSTVGEWRAPDGVRLRTRRWPPADGAATWARVLIVHGLGEHSGRYEHVGEQLSAAGLDVHALDLRGFGGSDGVRADVAAWSELERDVAAALAAVRSAGRDAPAPGPPAVLYGHSMGGLIALGAVLRGGCRPDALVLSSPGLDSSEGRLLRAAVRAFARVAPRLHVRGREDLSLLSRDPSVAARFAADPLVTRSATLRFAAAAFAAQAEVRAAVPRLGELAIPTLVLHGADDRRVPPSASEPLAALPGVTRRLYPGLRHELHNEPEGPTIVAVIVEWLRGAGVDSGPQSKIASGERTSR